MDGSIAIPGDTSAERLLRQVAASVPEMQQRAPMLDEAAAFPTEELSRLRDLGALAAPVPQLLGGLGWGSESRGAVPLMHLLRLLGRGNLSVGRLFEAHVNALRLVMRYGDPEQRALVARDALDGHLFGLWVTDAPDAPVTLRPDGTLAGSKAPCSGAGYASRALVTAALPSHGTQPSHGTRMLVIAAPGIERVDRSGWDTQGMRAACNGRLCLDGVRPAAVIGAPGDYLRQPDFSAGAWRTSAVTLGGLEALVGAMRQQLAARGRDGDQAQRARVGKALIALETARAWVARGAVIGEAHDGDVLDIANTVNLVRIAVETASLEALQLVQRALGLAAFRRGTLEELLLRDLATYLRQPAPDETLSEAAAHFMQRDLPDLT